MTPRHRLGFPYGFPGAVICESGMKSFEIDVRLSGVEIDYAGIAKVFTKNKVSIKEPAVEVRKRAG